MKFPLVPVPRSVHLMLAGFLLLILPRVAAVEVKPSELMRKATAATASYPLNQVVYITSQSNKQLKDGDPSPTLSNGRGLPEKWKITAGGNGLLYITSEQSGQNLRNHNDNVQESTSRGPLQLFSISDAGDGQVFITSHRNTKLREVDGQLAFSGHEQGSAKWKIEAAAQQVAVSSGGTILHDCPVGHCTHSCYETKSGSNCNDNWIKEGQTGRRCQQSSNGCRQSQDPKSVCRLSDLDLLMGGGAGNQCPDEDSDTHVPSGWGGGGWGGGW
eukprot:CAMPEP_0197662384 /NCGR_PEP_ID=MMETSP1338-20131121/53181_1 /TAXON_ID=43686 ORGANISM="Pelagodinium beii, Strain RCC1491" /NCGR_SAMPLE_ID=MMETSP1338 /ASSEMBLY_ACC=CAM_ASM_000754 /LENGTH=271 /DNA_ID=CAMNT_0043240213 /DNA_START=8 /DNA_END=820 /DNA_ORIENTATION=-